MIVVDASGMPDFASGARTRLRGWLGEWRAVDEAPPLGVRIARGSKLLDGLAVGGVEIEEVAPAGGPWRRSLQRLRGGGAATGLAARARLWHSETVPPCGPSGVPALVTVHDARWAEPRTATNASLLRWLPRYVAARHWIPRQARHWAGVVTVSPPAATRLAQVLELPPDRVLCIANANVATPTPLDPASAGEWLQRHALQSGRFFVAVGHLEPRKGIELALEAMAELKAAGGPASSLPLVIVGGGDLATWQARAAALRIADQVRFVGRASEGELATLLQHAVAMLFPTRYEGFGLPIYEAMAMGLPVIVRPLPPFAVLPSIDAAAAAKATVAALVRPAVEPRAWAAAMATLAATTQAPAQRVPLVVPDPWTWRDAADALAGLWRRELARR